MYHVQLDQFEGPLDLLLFFIRRDELDIYDIPIAKIADEYLTYVRLMEEIDLDGVGEFLYLAALLINIKARMLLPSQEVDEEGEPIDPRQELVERLLEYIRFKEGAVQLATLYEERSERFTRDQAVEADGLQAYEEEALVPSSLFDLVAALRRIITEAPDDPIHAILKEDWSVELQQEMVMSQLAANPRSRFSLLVAGKTKAYIIATFLAVLELARLNEIKITLQGMTYDFGVIKNDNPVVLSGDGAP